MVGEVAPEPRSRFSSAMAQPAGWRHSQVLSLKKNKIVDMHVPKGAYINYTKSLLAGRHPRSFRPVTAIWDFV